MRVADPSSVTVWVPGDAAARSVGADETAAAIAAEARRLKAGVRVVRNGSRGMLWLEPLVEVSTPAGRVAYGPVAAADAPSLFEQGFLRGAPHRLCHGPTDAIPWLARQDRLVFRRVGVTDPTSLEEYEAAGGWQGLRNALDRSGEQVVEEVALSGLRGRGGAGFPTGIKWKTVLSTPSERKFVVCNADEGDSGTFSDRMLMEGDPYLLIEGMAIAGVALGATKGFVYLRSEYPDAERTLSEAVRRAREAGVLGQRVLGSRHAFDVEIRRGAGSYVCGEETALLESLEGRRGVVRYRPPVPAVSGLFGRPTALNNVITLASVPPILAQGAEAWRSRGTGRSRGTMPFQLGGNVRQGGLVEAPMGVSLRELVEEWGGGTLSGRPVKAAQVGGPLGAFLPASAFRTPLEFEALAERGAILGHGGVVVFDDRADMARLARWAMEFCALESCGKCTPCRVGAVRGAEVLDRLAAGSDRAGAAALLRDLCDTMASASLCALGGMAPYPVLSALDHFPEDFGLSPASVAGGLPGRA